MTPFVVVTRYLQNMAHIVSHTRLNILDLEIPYIVLLAISVAIALLIWQFRNLTLRRILAIVFIFTLIFIAHNSMDVYLNMSFFDLQQNWHYFAYGTYVFYFFRAFYKPGISKERLILIAYFSAISASVFDETFQLFMSQRVFDISDIAKDATGVYCGLLIIFFITETYGAIGLKKISFLHRKISDYFKHTESLLMVLGLLTISFVLMSPLLSEPEYWYFNLMSGFGLFLLVFIAIHLMQFKVLRYVILSAITVGFLTLIISFAVNHKKNISFNTHGLTVYKGIPVPFYDIIIYPDGGFHLADKKHFFRPLDVNYFKLQQPDILLIASGSEGKGGKGFDIEQGTQFIYNHIPLKNMQLIILPTPEACSKFNELKKMKKSVLFIIHNTC